MFAEAHFLKKVRPRQKISAVEAESGANGQKRRVERTTRSDEVEVDGEDMIVSRDVNERAKRIGPLRRIGQ